jgi:hypothetical protein
MHIDAQSVNTMLKVAHGKAHTYVKNKIQKGKPTAYDNALRIQNRYISKVKTNILIGITRVTVADLRPLLLGEEHINYVAATTKLDTMGQWDVLTDNTHRIEVIQMIMTKLPG